MLKDVASKLKKANSIVVLTGAGVSTASGIPDFRSSEGLWSEDESREYYMSSDYFYHDPVDFWNKYKTIFQMKLLKDYTPNPVHQFIKELESDKDKVTVITQNVDGLHLAANSSHVIEYHGTLNQASCPECGESYSLDYVMSTETPYCQNCGAVLKPDVLLFGDMITAHDEAEQAIQTADFLLVMGTSLMVTPFNLLPHYAKQEVGMEAALINREPTVKDRIFDYVVHDDLSSSIEKLRSYISSL
ncbi:NAD-dependent protein deacylase [Halobacillus sp. B29]|uniref:NAD-dependent protein deacylase n=1 Tax=Halobacillus sp. B29 TaxID=3457432 RepID=UPI003FCC7565